jgi:uncharacterized protein YgiM (DUF1202 family)
MDKFAFYPKSGETVLLGEVDDNFTLISFEDGSEVWVHNDQLEPIWNS